MQNQNQSNAKPKPIATLSLAFSRAWRGLRVFASSSHWFIVCLQLLWLAIVIALGLVLRHSIENCSMQNVFIDNLLHYVCCFSYRLHTILCLRTRGGSGLWSTPWQSNSDLHSVDTKFNFYTENAAETLKYPGSLTTSGKVTLQLILMYMCSYGCRKRVVLTRKGDQRKCSPGGPNPLADIPGICTTEVQTRLRICFPHKKTRKGGFLADLDPSSNHPRRSTIPRDTKGPKVKGDYTSVWLEEKTRVIWRGQIFHALFYLFPVPSHENELSHYT